MGNSGRAGKGARQTWGWAAERGGWMGPSEDCGRWEEVRARSGRESVEQQGQGEKAEKVDLSGCLIRTHETSILGGPCMGT